MGITVLLALWSILAVSLVSGCATRASAHPRSASAPAASTQTQPAQPTAIRVTAAVPVQIPALPWRLHPRPFTVPATTATLTAGTSAQADSPLASPTATMSTTGPAGAVLVGPPDSEATLFATEIVSGTQARDWSLLPTPTPTRLGFPVAAIEQSIANTVPITEYLNMSVPGSPIQDNNDRSGTDNLLLVPTPTPPPAFTPQIEPSPEPTPDDVPRTARVPILMYHYVSVPPPDSDIYRQDLSVAPSLFAAHLDAMHNAGYKPISIFDLVLHLTNGAALPENSVIITFDDGYRDTYENAFPLLEERAMPATFFVITDFIDKGQPEYLTWDMAREMQAAGMDIESHGRNHVTLKNQDTDYLVWQALGSMETIEYEIGVRPRFVSYPAGDYDQATIDIFRSADYWAGFTTVQGATHDNQNPFELQRVRVRGTTSPEELLRLLALDW